MSTFEGTYYRKSSRSTRVESKPRVQYYSCCETGSKECGGHSLIHMILEQYCEPLLFSFTANEHDVALLQNANQAYI